MKTINRKKKGKEKEWKRGTQKDQTKEKNSLCFLFKLYVI